MDYLNGKGERDIYIDKQFEEAHHKAVISLLFIKTESKYLTYSTWWLINYLWVEVKHNGYFFFLY